MKSWRWNPIKFGWVLKENVSFCVWESRSAKRQAFWKLTFWALWKLKFSTFRESVTRDIVACLLSKYADAQGKFSWVMFKSWRTQEGLAKCRKIQFLKGSKCQFSKSLSFCTPRLPHTKTHIFLQNSKLHWISSLRLH